MKTKILRFCKIRLVREPREQVRAAFFFGEDEGHYQKAGELIFHVNEYQSMACALFLGLCQMVQRGGDIEYIPLRVTLEGEMAALGRADELEGSEDKKCFP